ncbi:hypothetical protein KC622_02380, partial [Candidatus Dojkabacteria bacterium]|nr:hypothetical protein [Candidatus Dojkabacteria bacterium]
AMANMTYTTDKSYLACESSDIILKDPRGSLTTEAAVERDQLTRNTGLVVLANVASESTTGIPHFNSPSLEIDPDSLFAQLIDLVRKADDGLPYSRELYMALEAFARLPKYVARGFHIDNDTDRLKIVLMLEYIKKFGIPRPADTARALQPEEKFNLTAARSVAEYIGSNRLPNLSRGYVMGAEIRAHHRIADLFTKYPVLNYSFPTFIEQVFGNLAYMQLDFPQLLGQEGGLPYVRLSEWESELKLSEPEPRQLIVQYETLWTLSCLARYYEDTNGYGGKIDSINKVLQLIILAKYLTDNLVHAKASTSPKFLSDLVNPKHNPQALSGKIKVSNWPQYPADKKVHGFGMTLDIYRIGTFTQALANFLPTHILRHYTAGLVIQPLLRINREEDWKEGLKRMIYSEAIEASSNPIFKQSGDEVVTLNSSGMYTVFRTQEFQKLFSSLK